MWLGDTIYADTQDMSEMLSKYRQQQSNLDYKKMREQVPIIGTWDDHDYGENNAGAEYPMKKQSRELFLDFIDEPKKTKRRAANGIYTSYTFGPVGQRAKIILFDLRYNRSLKSDPDRDLLGEEQWQWFEEELASSDADFHLLSSSTSVLSSSVLFTEDWDKFPKSYERLFELLDRYNPPGTLFLAGDKHFGCFSSRPAGKNSKRYYEMMSSGLTHTVPGFYKPVVRKYYGAHKSFTDINFGHIRFDWKRQQIICDIRNRLGKVALRRIYEKDPKTGLLNEIGF
jgi:alkaline phosphatase D